MASLWIKIEHVTPDKPEVFEIADILGIDPDAVTGKLIRFWIWADQQVVDGSNIKVTPAVIDRIVHCKGFTDALQKAGWLVIRSGSLQVPHFDRHNGQTAKERAITNRRKIKQRMRDKCHGETVTNVTVRGGQKPRPDEEEEEDIVHTQQARAREDCEIPDLSQAIEQCRNSGIPPDFAEMVYESWSSRGGKDGAGVVVPWLPHIRKRWKYEQHEWRGGTHKLHPNKKRSSFSETARERDMRLTGRENTITPKVL